MTPNSPGYYFIVSHTGRREIALYVGLWYRFGRELPMTTMQLADQGFSLGDLVTYVQTRHATPDILELIT